MPLYVYVCLSAIVGNFSPDFASVNYYSTRRLRILNKINPRRLSGKVRLWARAVDVSCIPPTLPAQLRVLCTYYLSPAGDGCLDFGEFVAMVLESKEARERGHSHVHDTHVVVGMSELVTILDRQVHSDALGRSSRDNVAIHPAGTPGMVVEDADAAVGDDGVGDATMGGGCDSDDEGTRMGSGCESDDGCDDIVNSSIASREQGPAARSSG